MICYKVCTHSREQSVCFQKNTMNIGLYSKHECLLGTWSSGAVFILGKYSDSEDGCWLVLVPGPLTSGWRCVASCV